MSGSDEMKGAEDGGDLRIAPEQVPLLGWLTRRALPAAVGLLFTAVFVGAMAIDASRSATPQGAGEQAASRAAFAQVASVLTSPRCMNCHTLTDYPRQGDDRHPHIMNVRRGPHNMGLPGMACATCHNRANNVSSGVPGADEDWKLAPLSMGWETLTPKQLCQTLKDPAKNGGRNGDAIMEHLNTHLVQWAWNPGRTNRGVARATPPLSYDAFVSASQRWLATGAECPET